jgi:hypothetical protein
MCSLIKGSSILFRLFVTKKSGLGQMGVKEIDQLPIYLLIPFWTIGETLL